MARIAGVNLPREKRTEIGLTYIYGIGRSTAQKVCGELDDRPEHQGARPHGRGGRAASRLHRREPHGRGRPPARALGEHQAADGDRLLPRPAPPARAARARPAHPDERSHAQGPEEDRRRVSARSRTRTDRGCSHGSPAQERRHARPHAPQGAQEHRRRPGAHQDVVQQHDRRAHRSRGQRHRVEVRRRRGLQGLAQVDAVRRAGDGRLVRPRGNGARPAEGRGLREGPRLRPRDGDPLAAGRRPRDRRPSRTSPRRPTTAAGRASGGGSRKGR